MRSALLSFLLEHCALRLALAVALACGCSVSDENAARARGAVAEALAHGDRRAALAAVGELRANLPDTPEALLEVAHLGIQAGDAPEAGWSLEEGVRSYPERDDLRLALAGVALLLGNPSLALEAIAPIGPESEAHPTALIARAQAELALGDLERALATLADAERRYPERPEARLVRIATLLSERRPEEVRAAIEEAGAALNAGEPEVQELGRRLGVALAQIQAQQGDPESAVSMLESMVEADPGELLAWRALIQVLVRQQRSDEALTLLDTALGVEDPPAGLFAIAGQVHAARGDDVTAEAALREFALRTESAAAYLPLVDLHSARGDAAAALAVLDEALARFPDDPGLHLHRMDALLALDRLAEARSAFARFRAATFDGDPQVDYLRARLELAEGNPGAAAARLRALAPRLDRAATQFWLGRALEASGDTEGARRRYGLAHLRDPAWPESAAARVALEVRCGNGRAVAAAARVLVRRAPERWDGWFAWVDALAQLGEGDAAARLAEDRLARFPDRPEPQLLLAKARRAQGRYDDALAALEAAEAADPAVDLAADRVLTLGMAGRLAEGIVVAREALAWDPDAAEVHAALAALLFAAGAGEEGAQSTERALALASDEPRPLRVRCEYRSARGLWPGARDDCTRYLAARPDDAGAHFMHGVALEGLGKPQAAAAAYRRAAALDEGDVRPRNNLAELLAAQGDVNGALLAAQEAYRVDGRSPQVMDTLGALYLHKGLVERAVPLLEAAHAALPEAPEVALRLALAYRDAGRSGEARVLLASLRAREGGSPALQARVEEAFDSLP